MPGGGAGGAQVDWFRGSSGDHQVAGKTWNVGWGRQEPGPGLKVLAHMPGTLLPTPLPVPGPHVQGAKAPAGSSRSHHPASPRAAERRWIHIAVNVFTVSESCKRNVMCKTEHGPACVRTLWVVGRSCPPPPAAPAAATLLHSRGCVRDTEATGRIMPSPGPCCSPALRCRC